MKHAFHEKQMDKKWSKLFFFTPWGLYKFKRLFQDILAASSKCHRIFWRVFEGIEREALIKNDLVVHRKGKEYNKRLKQLFKRSNEYNITFYKEKCRFGQANVTWFGNMYLEEGISLDPDKVNIINNWPEPEHKSPVKCLFKQCNPAQHL